MAKPEQARRIKTYSAASGYVYQYQFHELRPARREFSVGNEYVYLVSANRKTMFPLTVFIRRDAVERWGKQVGRAMTGTEEYAVAKMRLFQAFDAVEDLAASRTDLVVDDMNLQTLLGMLDI